MEIRISPFFETKGTHIFLPGANTIDGTVAPYLKPTFTVVAAVIETGI